VLSREASVFLQVTSFNHNGFLINNNIRVIGPMVIFPKSVFSWNVGGLEDVNENSLSLFRLIDPKPGIFADFNSITNVIFFIHHNFKFQDVLLVGTGDSDSKFGQDVRKWLLQNKIPNFEILPTVCAFFNLLSVIFFSNINFVIILQNRTRLYKRLIF
jgi:uncharacterized protein